MLSLQPAEKNIVALMANILRTFFEFLLLLSCINATLSSADLSPDFYDEVCPEALDTIREVVEEAIALDPRMGASLLRLHFHDCFVNVRLSVRIYSILF